MVLSFTVTHVQNEVCNSSSGLNAPGLKIRVLPVKTPAVPDDMRMTDSPI